MLAAAAASKGTSNVLAQTGEEQPWTSLAPSLKVCSASWGIFSVTGGNPVGDRVVELSAITEIDWKRKAYKHLGVTKELTKEEATERFGPPGECGPCPRPLFSFPAAEAPQPGFFAFASSTGLTEIEIARFDCFAYFDVEDRVRFGGRALAVPRSGRMPTNGGFAFWSGESLQGSARALRATGMDPEFSYWRDDADFFRKYFWIKHRTDDEVRTLKTDDGFRPITSLSFVTLLEVNAVRMISAEWTGIPSTCGPWNALYSASGPLRLLKGSDQTCDV